MLDNKKLSLQAELPPEKEFLRPVYQYIEKKQPVKMEKVIENFALTFSGRNFQELVERVGESLVEAGCAQKEQSGRLREQNRFVRNPQAVDSVVQCIRAEHGGHSGLPVCDHRGTGAPDRCPV